MSKLPIADAERLLSFSRRLLSSKLPENRLTPMEQRLLDIFRVVFLDSVLLARISLMAPTDSAPPPLDASIVAQGTRYALAVAIEIEAPLREIRDRLEER